MKFTGKGIYTTCFIMSTIGMFAAWYFKDLYFLILCSSAFSLSGTKL
jgi:hypothetical protein